MLGAVIDSVPTPTPPRFHVMAKPTGAICNLACTYCFFLDKASLYPESSFRMSDEVLETYVRQLIEAHRSSQVTFAWQGGEPTLMGLDFFRRAIELQERHRRPGMTFENTIQTNGTRLDDSWGAFLAEHEFLVGISIDGPRELHDANRVNKGGASTFDDVMRGLRVLQAHRVQHNVLTTVNRVNGDYPLEVYRFLRDEVGTDWMQFIPVVERLDAGGQPDPMHGTAVSDRSVRPAQFGTFLSTIFDEWVRNDVGRVFVQTFEAAIRNFYWGGRVRPVRVQRDVREWPGPRAQRRPVLLRSLRGAGVPPGQHPGHRHGRARGLATAAGVRGGQARHPAADVPRL